MKTPGQKGLSYWSLLLMGVMMPVTALGFGWETSRFGENMGYYVSVLAICSVALESVLRVYGAARCAVHGTALHSPKGNAWLKWRPASSFMILERL